MSTNDESVSHPAQETNPPASGEGTDSIELAGLNEQRGVRVNDAGNTAGYILFTPLLSDITYLIDREGRVVHVWKSDFAPGSEYLLADGHLMRGARLPEAPRFNGGGQSGRIEKLSWDGEVVWSFELANERRLLHHDFEPMPNGNILALAWEVKRPAEALAAGRAPEKIPVAGLWPDLIIEIEPTLTGGNVVWEWHVWDHLIQNQDASLENYGEPRDHPRRIDINAGPPLPSITSEELERLKATNRQPGNATVEDRGADMHHSNAIDYNAELDQIVISVRSLSEVWIIDHNTTTEAAAGPAGELLFRWGNPQTYGYGSLESSGLSHQHDIRWIPTGYPGAGNLLAFSNEVPGASPPYSEVVEFVSPVDEDGRYPLSAGQPFDPAGAAWTYSDGDFFSPFISSAHRILNGNTMVNFGPQGRFVEVTPEGEIVWEYWSPYSGEVRMPDGSFPQPGAPFMYATFRATFIPADHPALSGRDLDPLDPQPAPSVLREVELAPFR
ncbi:MAG: aryl-sulfate sulfotransferase [Gammaproteobacteria bacterium]|nr:aryl-sulfate sulfotransferase [Gammaproteobacteria bacterium]